MVYLKKFTLIFYNGSNYDYHFIIKKLAEELEEQFTCLGENNSKFSIPIENEFIRFGKKCGRNYKNHILQITIY